MSFLSKILRKSGNTTAAGAPPGISSPGVPASERFSSHVNGTTPATTLNARGDKGVEGDARDSDNMDVVAKPPSGLAAVHAAGAVKSANVLRNARAQAPAPAKGLAAIARPRAMFK